MEALARQRLHDGITDAQEATPRIPLGIVREQSLTCLGERYRREIQHRVRGEELEMRHRLVSASHYSIDLVRFRGEKRFVSGQLFCVRQATTLEAQRQTLDRTQTPRDSRGEQRIDECARVRQHRPPLAGRACKAMLDEIAIDNRHHRTRVSEYRADRRIAIEQCAPQLRGVHLTVRPEGSEATRRQRKASARHAVVEAQAVHPPLVDQMVYGSPVVRIRTRGKLDASVTYEADIGEVTEHGA